MREELEKLRSFHIHAGSLDVADEIDDLLNWEGNYDQGYNEALQDMKWSLSDAIEDLRR